MENIEKVVGDALEKSLPEIVDAVTEKKFAQLMEKSYSDINDIKSELKRFSLAQKTTGSIGTALKEVTMVGIVKDVFQKNVTTEEGFKTVADAHLKAVMDEGTSGEGAEFVFDQFENDVLRVINSYDVVSAVRILNLNKGDKITLPKAINGVTTTFKGEGIDYGTPTQPTTSEIIINMAKATTMTSMTEELLDDTMTTPDLYNLIVEFIGESQAQFLEDKILNGVIGANSTIEGLFVNTDVNEIALTAGQRVSDISDDTLVNAVMSIPKKFKRKSSDIKWVMSQYTLGKLMQLKTTDGSFLYPTLRDANPTLWSYQVVVSDEAPVQNSTEDVATASSIILGDMKYFTLVRRKGLTFERGFRTGDWQADIQSVKSNTRIGGKATFGDAFVKITNGAT